MINKDYILRMAEQFGRELAIILHLRKRNQHEDALIYIDELFLRMLGFTTSFINSAPEEMLFKLISPLGVLNLEKCLWIALLLKEKGEIYQEMGNENESYYQNLKSLHFFLAASQYEVKDVDIASAIEDLLQLLAEYEIPLATMDKVFRYLAKIGRYVHASGVLFAMLDLETEQQLDTTERIEQAKAFYQSLTQKTTAELEAGGMTRLEVENNMAALQERSVHKEK